MDEFKKNAFRKMEDESFDEYMMRIGNACHEHNLTWNEAAEILMMRQVPIMENVLIERNISHGRLVTTTRLNICTETLWQMSYND